MAVETTQTVGDANPRAEDGGGGLFKLCTVEVEGGHQIHQIDLDEDPYLARQLLVFYRQAYHRYRRGT